MENVRTVCAGAPQNAHIKWKKWIRRRRRSLTVYGENDGIYVKPFRSDVVVPATTWFAVAVAILQTPVVHTHTIFIIQPHSHWPQWKRSLVMACVFIRLTFIRSMCRSFFSSKIVWDFTLRCHPFHWAYHELGLVPLFLLFVSLCEFRMSPTEICIAVLKESPIER